MRVLLPDARHGIGIGAVFGRLIDVFLDIPGPHVCGECCLPRGQAEELVIHCLFYGVPRESDLSSGERFTLQAVRRRQGGQIPLIDLEEILAEDAIAYIVEVILSQVDKCKGFNLTEPCICRECKGSLPCLDLPCLRRNLCEGCDWFCCASRA